MNQKIKELAEQHAGSILMDLVMPDAGIPERIKWNIGCTTDHLEKFAKLIIEECTKVCETGVVDGWQIDSGLSAAFSTEIKNRFKQFEVDK